MQAPNDAIISIEDESHISEDLNKGSNISGVEASADGAIDAKSSLKLLKHWPGDRWISKY